MEGKLREQKDAEVRQLQKEIEKLLQERKVYLQALEEEKKRNCIQVRRRRILITVQRNTLSSVDCLQTSHLRAN